MSALAGFLIRIADRLIAIIGFLGAVAVAAAQHVRSGGRAVFRRRRMVDRHSPVT
jgi:hypothetical protein